MIMNRCDEIYARLKDALRAEVEKNGLRGEKVSVRCSILSAKEAIGDPEDTDYPIIKGKEKMIEATFKGARGQVFTDEYGNADYSVDDILELNPDTNRKRADFIAALNAIFRYLGLCDRTIHCKDAEPRECARLLLERIEPEKKVLLVGFQPRFVEFLSSRNEMRVVDLDKDNIGCRRFGVLVEPAENTEDAIGWCDLILATGTTLLNCTIGNFLDRDKPVIFYGVSISAPAKILGLDAYCAKGN